MFTIGLISSDKGATLIALDHGLCLILCDMPKIRGCNGGNINLCMLISSS